MDLILDGGNARYKWFLPQKGKYGDFRHMLAQLSEAEWNKVSIRGKPPAGFARVNGIPYAFGDAARRYQVIKRKRGAARYTPEYYGVLLAYTLNTAAYNARRIRLIASFPPGDVDYVPTLIKVAQRVYTIEGYDGIASYQLEGVETFDEPLGGYFHYTLTTEGTERRKNPIASKTILVLDAGGHTVDCVAIDPGGDVDLSTLDSTRTGTLDMLTQFEKEVRSSNIAQFQTAGDIDVKRIEQALLTGKFPLGKRFIDVREEAEQALTSLCNDVVQIIESKGSLFNYDVILMTGGGSALIINTLRNILPDIDFITADEDMSMMQYANVAGGAKMAALMRRAGVW